MQPSPGDAVAKALAFANGLRKNTTVAGRRWAQWPGGAADFATVLSRIDGIQARLQATPGAPDAASIVPAAIADLRAILEWTTYQSASIATARAVLVARKTRTFAERFGLLENGAPSLAILLESETSLIENVRTKNGYMESIAERHPHLQLPPPLVDVSTLTQTEPPRQPGRLVLMQQLIKSAKRNPRPR